VKYKLNLKHGVLYAEIAVERRVVAVVVAEVVAVLRWRHLLAALAGGANGWTPAQDRRGVATLAGTTRHHWSPPA
jgi:hypothetical protein